MLKDEEFLFFQKPGRYIGKEWNSVYKNPEGKKRFLIVYPDIYEVGMSSLAIILLYHLINERDDSLCERLFSPGLDLEEYLLKNDIPLFSIETRTAVKNFDIIGFSLQSQLNFTNVLDILNLSQINIFSKERKGFPIIIAGGPVALNPAPFSPFIDGFVIGEGEEVVEEILDNFKLDRDEYLNKLNEIEGVYIPEFGKKIVNKRVIWDFENSFFPEKLLVPYIQTIHDRAVVEIFRGCDRGCRFCISGMEKRPRRERSVDKILEISEKVLKNTGYEEISLLSLSTSDYKRIDELLIKLKERLKDKKITISLPSLRIDNFSLKLLDLIDTGRKVTLTFAPEGGTEKIRNIMNKPIKDDEILNVIKEANFKGYKKIKLYFLIGVPYEDYDDIYGIAELINKIKDENKLIKLSISINPFIPKPFTPFQWEKFISKDEFIKKIKIIKEGIKNVNLSYRGWEESFIEAIISRGDEQISELIYEAYLEGEKFSNWKENFHFETWEKILKEKKFKSVDKILNGFLTDEELPWDFINIGIDKKFFLEEREKSKNCEITKPCFMDFEKCSNCGVCFNLNDSKNRI
ncbi:MAG TPA: radical SAM protein [Caldisericia bacterium]|nr:radical SAM protein [Caldisericia bacterium]